MFSPDLVELSIEISHRLNQTTTRKNVFSEIGSSALAITGADHGIIVVSEDGATRCYWSASLPDEIIHELEKTFQHDKHRTYRGLHPGRTAHLNSDLKKSLDHSIPGSDIFLKAGIRASGFWSLLFEGNYNASIGLFFDRPHRWQTVEKHAMALLARLATTPIENALVFESLQNKAQSTLSLYRALTPLFNAQAGPLALAQQIVDTIYREFSLTHCDILLYDELVDGLRIAAQRGYDEVLLEYLPISGKGLTVAAFNKNEIIYVPDVTTNDHYVNLSPKIRCELVLPLRTASRVLGVLNVESQMIDDFDETSRQVLASYAERAALALENAHLFELMDKQARQTDRLSGITQSALQASDLESVLRAIADTIGELFDVDASFLCFKDDERLTLITGNYGPLNHKNSSVSVTPRGFQLTLAVINSGRTIVVNDYLKSEYYDPNSPMPSGINSLLGLPLNADNQTMGMVMIGFVPSHRFTQEEIALAERAAGQASLALTKMKSLELARRRALEAENLRSATAALTSSLDINQVLHDILNHLEQVVHHDSACIFMRRGNELIANAGRGISPADGILGNAFTVDNPFYDEILATNRPLVLEDAQTDRRIAILGKTSRTRAWMGIPLIAGGAIIGILTLESRKPGAFDQDQAALAQAFANQAAAALQNAGLFEQEKQRSQELAALHTAAAALESTLDSQELLKRVLDAAASAVPSANQGRLVMFNPESGGLQVQASFGYPPEKQPDGHFPEQGIALINTIRQRHPAIIFPDGAQGGSAIVAPLLIDPQVFGAISLEASSQAVFTNSDLNLLVNFARTATAALRNAQLYNQVQKLAITDPLTGLMNRRGFFDLGLREFERSIRYHHALGCIMVDADQLKQVNDSFGHAMGDQLLISIANEFRNNLRKTDIIGRYGGDEFVILLPETDLASVLEIAGRLRDSISRNTIGNRNIMFNQSISLGIAILDGNCQSLDTLLSRADRALYHSKQEGRNRYSVWEPGMPIS